MEKGKVARKERIWSDYKNQESFREGMQAVVGSEPVFDARNFQVRGADGQFKPQQSWNKKFVPKNIVTVQYLVWAYAVPYQTFMRWKRDGFSSKKKDTYHKGKSVVTDSEYARQIYTAQRMYVSSAMDIWKAKQLKTYGEIKLKDKREYCASKKLEFNKLPDDQKVPFEKLARDHQVKQALMVECIADALQKKQGGNCLRSYRSIANATDNWCSHVTIHNWLKAQPTFKTYAKQVRPGLTDINREKQVLFGQHVRSNWNIPRTTKILWTMSDEKWWHGLVLRTFAKMCPALGI